jgi:hypothetical protein
MPEIIISLPCIALIFTILRPMGLGLWGERLENSPISRSGAQGEWVRSSAGGDTDQDDIEYKYN